MAGIIDKIKKSQVKDKKDKLADKSDKDSRKSRSKKAGRAHELVLDVLETEKSSNIRALGKYTFLVKRTARKSEIAKAVSEYFGVNVVGVNVIKGQGKRVRFGGQEGKRKNFKKAMVTLGQGESINFK
ncbi:MAG: 50S ribosomal protein L23 [Patescibacteria group bacterium]|nr:50S ribosomal protein L23 [Patescibacteria group bacterium]